MDHKELALKIAEHSFQGKKDLAGMPYINHLKRVANSFHDREHLFIIALLHDLLEDCPEWNEKSLRALFGKNIVDSVVVLTRKRDWDYDDYISQILTDAWAIEVKKADLLDNMDITRLTEIKLSDYARLQKYHKAYFRILKEGKIA